MSPGESSPLRFKLASEPHEFEQIARLNHQTFVEEIPQHRPGRSGRRVDRFHDQNTYAICLRGGCVIGMIAARGRRPFSLDAKLPDLDDHLPTGRRVCELRLLATRREERGGRVFIGLVRTILDHCVRAGYDLAVISGTTRQLKLYRHLGFVPFGPLVGSAGAMFQPMYLTLETLQQRVGRLLRARPHSNNAKSPAPGAGRRRISFLPGPVEVSPAVRRALAARPVSHRDPSFVRAVTETRAALRELTGARHVQILCGTGTLANDSVAAQLAHLGGPGVILSNGEFGDRLVDHASRFGLRFGVVRAEWGDAFDEQALEAELNRTDRPEWLWVVHCETSSGVLNDLAALKRMCAQCNVRLCVDCVSSLGVVPVDLSGVYLASSSSGKGLASYAGLALIFHECVSEADPFVPRCFDLSRYEQSAGVPFTLPSCLLHALRTAVEELQPQERYARISALSTMLHEGLNELGLRPLASRQTSSPAVATVLVPPPLLAADVAWQCRVGGFEIAWQSDYLRPHEAIQICLMGELVEEHVRRLLATLRTALLPHVPPASPARGTSIAQSAARG